MSFLERSSSASSSGGGPVGPLAGVLKLCPAVVEYLTAAAWPDGEVRETSTLLMFAEEGGLKLCLSDRAQGRTLWRSGESIESCVKALEEALKGGQADWRRSRQQRPPERGGKGKGKAGV